MDPQTPNPTGDNPPATPPDGPNPNPSPKPDSTPPTEPLIYPEIGQVDQITNPNTKTEPPPEEHSSDWLKTLLLGFVNWVIIPIAIVLILHNYVFQAYHVIGSSMVPTLHDTDYLIISKVGASEASLAKAFGKSDTYIPKRGEIIVFHYPKDPSLVFIKRVIGLPSERVVVKDGQITVYNQQNPGGFNPDSGTVRAQYPTLGDIDEVVPQGNVFVVGDNRTPNGSYDSRDWGMLPSSYIIGDTVLRLLPVDKAGLF